MLLSRGGRAIRFPEDQISVVGRAAQGVKGMDLKGDGVVGMLLIRRLSTVLIPCCLAITRRSGRAGLGGLHAAGTRQYPVKIVRQRIPVTGKRELTAPAFTTAVGSSIVTLDRR